MTFSGWVATLAGWYVTEIGRQPWLVSADSTPPRRLAVPATMLADAERLSRALCCPAHRLRRRADACRCPAGRRGRRTCRTRPLQPRRRRDQRQGENSHDPRLADLCLPLIFAGLMGLAILVYVILDGFDLGIGILFAAASPRKGSHDLGHRPVLGRQRDLAGAGRRPAARRLSPWRTASSLPGLYMPVRSLLVGLILRGVAFDFRAKVPASRKGPGTGCSSPDRCWRRCVRGGC